MTRGHACVHHIKKVLVYFPKWGRGRDDRPRCWVSPAKKILYTFFSPLSQRRIFLVGRRIFPNFCKFAPSSNDRNERALPCNFPLDKSGVMIESTRVDNAGAAPPEPIKLLKNAIFCETGATPRHAAIAVRGSRAFALWRR